MLSSLPLLRVLLLLLLLLSKRCAFRCANASSLSQPNKIVFDASHWSFQQRNHPPPLPSITIFVLTLPQLLGSPKPSLKIALDAWDDSVSGGTFAVQSFEKVRFRLRSLTVTIVLKQLPPSPPPFQIPNRQFNNTPGGAQALD